MTTLEDPLNSRPVYSARIDSSLKRRVLNVVTQHSVIDKVRCTGRPRVDFQLHQSSRDVVG